MAGKHKRLTLISLIQVLVLLLGALLSPASVIQDSIEYEWVDMNNSDLGRLLHQTMAYDASVDKVILFSGRYFNGSLMTKTYAYDLQTNTWENLNPDTSPPSRQYAHMVYNSIDHAVVHFGGADSMGNVVKELWSYDYNDNNWTQLSSHPTGFAFPDLAYIESENALFLAGGEIGRAFYDETWWYFFANDSWVKSDTTNPVDDSYQYNRSPPVYNPATDSVFLFSDTYTSEYSIADREWTVLETTENPTRAGVVDVIYDSISDRFIRYGGFLSEDGVDWELGDETWVFDYHSLHWEELDFEVKPPARDTDSNFEFNSKAGVGILYGGGEAVYHGDTWVLNISQITGDTTSGSSDTSSFSGESESTIFDPVTASSLVLVVCVVLIRRRERELT